MSLAKKILFTALAFTLFACHEHEEIDNKFYLETHPLILMREVNLCNERMKVANAFSAHCVRVAQTFTEYSQLVEARRKDPLAFGEKIIQLQMIAQPAVKDTQDMAVMLAVIGASGPE